MRELNGFWLFVSSCLPGCGQMYQGYMKRGASLLALFWVTVCITSILQIGALGVLIAAIWLYAYFDSYNLRTLCKEGRPMQDTYLFGSDDDSLSVIFHGKGRKSWAGSLFSSVPMHFWNCSRIWSTVRPCAALWAIPSRRLCSQG